MPTLLTARAWAGHLLMLVALGAAVALGLWQLDVWSAHREAAQRDLANAEPVPLATVMSGDDPFPGDSLGRPVELSGSWLPEGTVYVDHRWLEDREGYWVVTPVLIDGSAVPVVRGWSEDTDTATPSGDVAVTGWLQASEGSGEPDPDPADDVISSMRIASLTQRVDADLYSGYVVARDLRPAGTASAGLLPVTPDAIPAISGTTSLRNFLYALQWWFFAGFAVYIWWRWCRDELAAAGGADHPEPDRAEVG